MLRKIWDFFVFLNIYVITFKNKIWSPKVWRWWAWWWKCSGRWVMMQQSVKLFCWPKSKIRLRADLRPNRMVRSLQSSTGVGPMPELSGVAVARTPANPITLDTFFVGSAFNQFQGGWAIPVIIITECEGGQNKNKEGAVNVMVKQKGKRLLVSGSGPFYFYS